MSLRHLLLVPVLLCAAAAVAQNTPPTGPSVAYADFVNPQGNVIGSAIITQKGTGVLIALDVRELPPGIHGIHIHAVGKCEGPAFASAGGHFNPDMKMHGKDNAMGPHAGDLLNFTADANGNGMAMLSDDHVTLSDGPNSLFHPGGTSLVIHAMADDYKTDPAGNSGARIACGVIYNPVNAGK